MGKKKKQFSMMFPPQPQGFMPEQGIGFFSMLRQTWRMDNLQSLIQAQIALQAARDAQAIQPYEFSVRMAELQAKFISFGEQVRQQKWITESLKQDAKTKKLKNVQLLLDCKKSEYEFKQLTAGEPKEE